MSLDLTVKVTIEWRNVDADQFVELLDRTQRLAHELEELGATVTAGFEALGSHTELANLPTSDAFTMTMTDPIDDERDPDFTAW